MGIFEYGAKGLPHGLLHAPELVKTFGHHGGCCSCVGEAGHKLTLKTAGKFSRTYGDKNKTQSAMLGYVCFQHLWTAVFVLNENTPPNQHDSHADVSDTGLTDDSNDSEAHTVDINQLFRESNDTVYKLRVPLDLTDGWRNMVPDGRNPPAIWGSTFLSKRVLITRNELLTLLRTVLELEQTWSNITRLARLHWESFGCCVHEAPEGVKRIFVGINPSSPGRRDFVRLRGSQDGTALSVQIMMFVRVSGLSHAQITVPERLLNSADKTCNRHSVILALVRWLSPDPRATLRDDKLLPVCPPPFGSNHVLWQFTKLRQQRGYFTDHLFARQLHLFPGPDRASQRRNAMETHSRARYGLINLETIDRFINCTYIDNDHNSILETVTLPFV